MPRSRNRKRPKSRGRRRSAPAVQRVIAEDLGNRHVLDTSAWNHLLDDTDRDGLVGALREIPVLPTALSIEELCATPDDGRRRALLLLVKAVGGRYRPLAPPNQLIIRACQGYAKRDAHLTLNDGDDSEGAWIAINDPALVDAEAQRLARQSNESRESSFRNMNEGLRGSLQALFSDGLSRPRSIGALIRHYNGSDDFLYHVVNPIYERAVGRPLPSNEIRQLIASLPHWPLFLVGYGCAIYQRAVQAEGFSHKSNPGNLDLWSATYLPSCNVFVTGDKRQRRALKVLNQYNSRQTQILSYKEWRTRLRAGDCHEPNAPQ